MSISYSLATSAQFYINVKNDTVVPSKDDTGAFTLTNAGGAVTLVTNDVTRGNVLSFNGTSASFTTNYYLPIIHTRLFWVKLNATTGQTNNTLSTDQRPLFYNGGPSIIFSMNFNGGTGTWRYDTVSVTTGTWYFYALTYDGTTANLYTNGVLKKNEVVTSYQTPEILWIGQHRGGAFLNGYLDNIRCYNSVLNQTQIQNIYNYELANPTSFYYENGYSIPPSIGFTTIPLVAAIPQAFSSNTLTVSSYTENTFQNGTYVASASSYAAAGTEAFKMFNGILNDIWHSGYNGNSVGSVYNQQPYNGSGVYQGGNTNGLVTWSTTIQSVGSIGGEWVQIQLPYKLQLTTYSLYARQDLNWSARYPTIYYVVGSNDGTTWYQLDYRTFSGPITPNNGPITYTLNPNTGYMYFRLITNAVNPGGNVANYGDLQLTGYASGNDYSIPPSIGYSYIVNPNGLAVYIDFTNPSCYPGSGTTFYNLIDNTAQAITIGSGLSARVSYTSSIGLRLNNSGINNVNTLGVCLSLTTYTVQTISIWYKIYSSGTQYLCDARTNPPSGSGLTTDGYVYSGAVFGSAWNTVYVNGGVAQNASTVTWTGVVQPTTPTPWRNVTLISTSSAVTYPTIAGRYPKTECLDCAVAFILVYNRVLSQDENAINYNSLLSKMNALS